jgi:AraC-like DNA-binding protein
MNTYHKLLESIEVSFKKAQTFNVITPITVENICNVENTILHVHSGEITLGYKGEKAHDGDFIFIPAGKTVQLTFGYNSTMTISNDVFLRIGDKFIIRNKRIGNIGLHKNNFSSISFDASIFVTQNFFHETEIKPFVIKKSHSYLKTLISDILEEEFSNRFGKATILKQNTEKLVIGLLRYLLEENLYSEQLSANYLRLKDPRIVSIYRHVKNNIDQDLSNLKLAEITSLSEVYIGNFFKINTGLNLQEYIEGQRMEIAVQLLKDTHQKVKEISKMVGFSDAAYFCKRFKYTYGISPNLMRRRACVFSS